MQLSRRTNGGVQRWLPVAACTLALLAAIPGWQDPGSPSFAPPRPQLPAPGIPVAVLPELTFTARLLPNPTASAHAPALAELADGRIAAAWFAGSREGAADVAIHYASFDGQRWSAPTPIVTRQAVQHDTARLVRKLGNPVLAADGAGRLHLWFVSVGYGGWAGSSINHVVSGDGGQSWGAATKLITSPFWNVSTLVRTPPLALASGHSTGWGLPAYHEFAAKRGEWLRLDAAGRVLDKSRLPGTEKTLQPAIVALDSQRALALLRDAGPANRIRMATSDDAGHSWQPARNTALPNPNASVALLRMHDGRLLLAYNPQSANRNQLALATSQDDGQSWSPPRLVENATGGDEFSYPALLQARDGTLHLAYTWQRRAIKHLTLTPAWLATPQ